MKTDNKEIIELRKELAKLKLEEKEELEIIKLKDEIQEQKLKGTFFYELKKKLGF